MMVTPWSMVHGPWSMMDTLFSCTVLNQQVSVEADSIRLGETFQTLKYGDTQCFFGNDTVGSKITRDKNKQKWPFFFLIHSLVIFSHR